MATLERGLGRGLDSLLRSTREADIPSRDAKKLALTQLTPGPHQPRKYFDDASLADLATSIKNQGIVQPLIVRPQANSSPQMYEIVAGERRWRAARLAGLTEVPVVICSYTDAEAMTVALVENLQRENLNALEEAEALQVLRDTHNLSQEDLAAKLGKSRSAVANSLRLLQLPQNCREALADSRISAGHARTLLSIGDEEIRDKLLNGIIQQDLSVRDAESIADYWKRTGRLPAPLDEAEPGAARAEKETRHRMSKPQRLKDIQVVLRKTVHHGASISGNEEKGRIALPYTSAEELNSLLTLLGMSGEILNRGTAESLPVDDGAALGSAGAAPADDPVGLDLVSPDAAEAAPKDVTVDFGIDDAAPADGSSGFGAEDAAPVDDGAALESALESAGPAPADDPAGLDPVSLDAAEAAPKDAAVDFGIDDAAPADGSSGFGTGDAAPVDDGAALESAGPAPADDPAGLEENTHA